MKALLAVLTAILRGLPALVALFRDEKARSRKANANRRYEEKLDTIDEAITRAQRGHNGDLEP